MLWLHFIFLLIQKFIFPFALANSNAGLQEKIYSVMVAHQAAKISDEEFIQQAVALKQDSQWTDQQSQFLNDYVSDLPSEKQQKFLPLLESKSIAANTIETTPVESVPFEDEKIETKTQTWVKWALVVAGAALLLSPYQIIIHAL